MCCLLFNRDCFPQQSQSSKVGMVLALKMDNISSDKIRKYVPFKDRFALFQVYVMYFLS